MFGVSLADGAGSGAPSRARFPRGRGVLASPQAGYLLGLLGLVAAYYASAHLGYAFQFAGPVAAIVWLPAGVAIAFLYLAGLRFWPGVVIGDLLVNNYSALPVGSALGQTVGNLLEVVVAVALLRRFAPRGSPLASPAGVAVVVGAIAAGAAVSATGGVVSLKLGGVIGSSIPGLWRTWWLGDFCGALIVLSLAIAWSAGSLRAWLRGRRWEATLLLLAVGGTSVLAMGSARPLTYIVFPALIWAALRFGQRGATLSILIVSGFAVWATTHYYGPFVFHSIPRSVLSTQLFIAAASISTLTLAAVVSEREFLSRRLGASRARLIGAADSERRRLERDLHDGAQQRLVALAAHLGLGAIEAEKEPERAGALFESAQAELQVAIDELRTLAHGLHPSLLSRLGLAGAIHAVADSSSIPVNLVNPPQVRLDQRVETTAYFVAVEAIANAQKHSQASAIRVRFDLGSLLRVEIADDGIGGAIERPGLGLEGMKDRVEGVGGTLEIDSPPGGGTRIAAVVPAGTRIPVD